jgi:glycosyltransferase involved in cell wall biosynthesis
MKLLIITQKVDSTDAILGFFHDWLIEFAKQVDELTVISLFVGKYNLPDNVKVYSLGKELGKNRMSRYLKFYQLIFKLLPKNDKVLAHMCPEYIVVMAPINYFYNKDLYLWYVHKQVTKYLRCATKLVKKAFTASTESYQIDTAKKVILGHGINIERFKSSNNNYYNNIKKIIYVGRITPIKNQLILIEAMNILINERKQTDIVVEIIGNPLLKSDQAFAKELADLTKKYHLEKYIYFRKNVNYLEILTYYQTADLSLNLSPTGGLDKTVLESMACQIPVIVANNSFKNLFNNYQTNLVLEQANAKILADKIEVLIKLPQAEKVKIGEYLREQIVENHSLPSLIRKLILAMQ